MSRLQPATFILLALMLSTSCDGDKTEASVSLTASAPLLTFRIDEHTANISPYLDHFFDESSNTEMLISLNRINNELQFFNIENGALVKKLPFEIEGDRGVGAINGFYVLNLDSIFLFPSSGNRLFLTDYSANMIQRINYDVPDGYGNAQVSSTYFSAKPYFSDGKLIVKTLYQGSYSTVSNAELSARHLSYAIDLSTGVVKNLPATFPIDYWSDVKKHFQFSFSGSANGYVYSLWGDHSLYLAKTLSAVWTKMPGRSEHLREEWEALPLGGDRNDRRRYFAASAHYGNIIHDPYRDVYYRFAYPKVETENEDELRQLALFPAKFSIMIFDKDLNILGEQFFDTPYATSNAFVGKEGLYLSINHPANKENKEDYFTFKLLKVSGL